jgi:hypothetical protein
LLSNLFSAPITKAGIAFSDAINNQVVALKDKFGSFGWELNNYTAANMMIVNVPEQAGKPAQHILNTQTGGWSRFTGLRANSWAFLDGEAYYASNGGVYQYGKASDETINWDYALAYANMNNPLLKVVKEVQLFMQAYGSLKFLFTCSVDFNKTITAHQISASMGESKWDISSWDTTPWQPESKALAKRIAPAIRPAQYFSFGVSGATKTEAVRFISMSVFYEGGKNLV